MAGLTIPLTLKARSAVILATTVGMSLPLPAHCAACSMPPGECGRCATAKTATARTADNPKSLGCQHRANSDVDLCGDGLNCSESGQAQRCGCSASPVHRISAAERVLPYQDFDAALPVPARPLIDISVSIDFVYRRGDLPPPIPHRILHCSWLI